MHCIFLASVLNIHFAIIGNVALYFVAGLEAVLVAFFLGGGVFAIILFVTGCCGGTYCSSSSRYSTFWGFAIGTAFGLGFIGLVSNGPWQLRS